MRKALAAILLTAFVLFALPGARSDVEVMKSYINQGTAVQDVIAGRLDMYFWNIPPYQIPQVSKNPNVKVYLAVGGMFDILANPCPTQKLGGPFNPFSIREVRYALNYLIDRSAIVTQVLHGYGFPMISPLTPVNPDYLTVIKTLSEFNFKYNPKLAKKMITEALTKAGAVFKDGKWYYNGKPIVIKFMIRSDDPLRKQIGDMLADELEKLGFTVERIYGDFMKAYKLVYAADPGKYGWTLYTEGWGSSSMTKYSDGTVVQMYAPYLGYMPGWQTPNFCNYQNATIDKIAKALMNGEYQNKAQRDELLNKLVKLGIEESVRVFVAAPIFGYPVNKKVQGIVDDLQAGIANHWTEMLAYKPGSPELKIGVRYVHKWAWNPVGGYQDLYSVIIRQGLVDGFMANNPYTGDKIPLLAKSWTVKQGNILVPTSAITYDYKHHKWVHVKPCTVAKSMVVLHLRSNWGVFHDNQKVRITDMLYWVYLVMEWGTKADANDTRYDSFIAAVDSNWIQSFKGVQFIPPNTLVIYSDMKHFDPNELADAVSSILAPSVPWELVYAEEQAVMSGKVAFSSSEAGARGVDWLDALNPKHVKLVLSYLEKDAQENVVPPQVAQLAKLLGIKVKPNYKAVIAFIKKHGHMVIGNGPLYLDKYYPTTDSAVLKAFRNPKYPFMPEQFDYLEYKNVVFAQVKSVNVPAVVAKGTPLTVTVSVVNKKTKQPLDEAIVFVAIYNPAGKLVASGFAKAKGNGQFVFTVTNTADWEAGGYSVKVIAYSKQAFWPSMAKATFIVIG